MLISTVLALHTAVQELSDEAENKTSVLSRSDGNKKQHLGRLIRSCNMTLRELDKLLNRYKSLGTNRESLWERLQFGMSPTQEIREKVMKRTSELTLFLSVLDTGSLGRIETKLDELIEDVRRGRREGTILSMADDDATDAEEQWNTFKKELLEDNFSKTELEVHKGWIKAKLQELIDREDLQEQPPVSAHATVADFECMLNTPRDQPSRKLYQATVEDYDDSDDAGIAGSVGQDTESVKSETTRKVDAISTPLAHQCLDSKNATGSILPGPEPQTDTEAAKREGERRYPASSPAENQQREPSEPRDRHVSSKTRDASGDEGTDEEQVTVLDAMAKNMRHAVNVRLEAMRFGDDEMAPTIDWSLDSHLEYEEMLRDILWGRLTRIGFSPNRIRCLIGPEQMETEATRLSLEHKDIGPTGHSDDPVRSEGQGIDHGLKQYRELRTADRRRFLALGRKAYGRARIPCGNLLAETLDYFKLPWERNTVSPYSLHSTDSRTIQLN